VEDQSAANLKLVSVHGKTTVKERLHDEVTGVEVHDCVRVYRHVQMYQWIESFTPAKDPSSCCCVSGTRSPEQYTYKLGWANKPVSISSVQSEVMENPTEMPVASQMLITDQAYLG
jgi:hypothetical protein